jgi:glycyl-tRNA synthetase beta subunit
MNYQNSRISEIAKLLKKRIVETGNNPDVLRSIELKALFDELKNLIHSFGSIVSEEEFLNYISKDKSLQNHIHFYLVFIILLMFCNFKHLQHI